MINALIDENGMHRLDIVGNGAEVVAEFGILINQYYSAMSKSSPDLLPGLRAAFQVLTPERCAEFARADAEGRYIVMRDAEQEGVARLRELAESDKDGRVVVLPCKVGDGLWTFCSHPVEQVYSFTVTSISTLNGRTMLNTSRCGVIDARDVGKTVFLTHKEAEKALEAMNEK